MTPVTLALALAGLLAGGCSTFNRDWRHHADAAHDELAGLWQGSWQSDANGHHGGLRCIISPMQDSRLETRYRATYMGILRFEYSLPVDVEGSAGAYSFTGQADLGALAGGVYTYSGGVTGTSFRANYQCERDHGTFRMQRR
ncbi:MAG: hypothetical protein O2923_10130 [Verrucomicrobia bacterium]|nr:hypothetical protein [Verrucomicrobiota bacterium]MDA1086315.1 hypothetical protein [Verrucomicrobiota bacterium]